MLCVSTPDKFSQVQKTILNLCPLAFFIIDFWSRRWNTKEQNWPSFWISLYFSPRTSEEWLCSPYGRNNDSIFNLTNAIAFYINWQTSFALKSSCLTLCQHCTVILWLFCRTQIRSVVFEAKFMHMVVWSGCCRLLFLILLTNTQSCSILCISLMEMKLIVSKGEVQWDNGEILISFVTIVGCKHVLICFFKNTAWGTFCVVFLPNEHRFLMQIVPISRGFLLITCYFCVLSDSYFSNFILVVVWSVSQLL